MISLENVSQILISDRLGRCPGRSLYMAFNEIAYTRTKDPALGPRLGR